jgi:hypothetical protein
LCTLLYNICIYHRLIQERERRRRRRCTHALEQERRKGLGAICCRGHFSSARCLAKYFSSLAEKKSLCCIYTCDGVHIKKLWGRTEDGSLAHSAEMSNLFMAPMLTMANFICKCNKLRVAFLFIRININVSPKRPGEILRPKQDLGRC